MILTFILKPANTSRILVDLGTGKICTGIYIYGFPHDGLARTRRFVAMRSYTQTPRRTSSTRRSGIWPVCWFQAQGFRALPGLVWIQAPPTGKTASIKKCTHKNIAFVYKFTCFACHAVFPDCLDISWWWSFTAGRPGSESRHYVPESQAEKVDS